MASSRSRTPAKRPARSSTSKAGSRKAQVEVVEEAKGGGVDAGIAIVTALLLVVAFFMLDKELGDHYGEGMFFAKSYTSQG